jgi:hypothetical protein
MTDADERFTSELAAMMRSWSDGTSSAAAYLVPNRMISWRAGAIQRRAPVYQVRLFRYGRCRSMDFVTGGDNASGTIGRSRSHIHYNFSKAWSSG